MHAINVYEIKFEGMTPAGFENVKLKTSHGVIHTQYYKVLAPLAGVILVGGVGGDFDSPAQGQLYPELCKNFNNADIAAIRLQFRHPRMLEEAVHDVLAGLQLFYSVGIQKAALIGHSLGGAVIAQAAAYAQRTQIKALVGLATQSADIEVLSEITSPLASLFLHGAADRVLPVSCSEYAYSIAPDPKKIHIYPDAGHDLGEVKEEVRTEVLRWIFKHI